MARTTVGRNKFFIRQFSLARLTSSIPTWRVVLMVGAENKRIRVAALDGLGRVRRVVLRGEVEALVAHGRYGEVEALVTRGDRRRVRYHRFLLDRIVLQVLLDLHVDHAVFVDRQRPRLAVHASAFVEAVLGHRVVVDAHPGPLVIHALRQTERAVLHRHSGNSREGKRAMVFRARRTYVFLNGYCVPERQHPDRCALQTRLAPDIVPGSPAFHD